MQADDSTVDPKLFSNVLARIQRILRHNYLENFYQERKVELLSIPTAAFKTSMPKLEFNSIGPDAPSMPSSHHAPPRNCNIFEIMLTRKEGLNSQKSIVGAAPRRLPDEEERKT